jgi:hypothetical protein
VAGLKENAALRARQTRQRAEDAIAATLREGRAINFHSVSEASGVLLESLDGLRRRTPRGYRGCASSCCSHLPHMNLLPGRATGVVEPFPDTEQEA